MDWGGGWGAAGGLAMTVGMTAVALLVVAGVFLLIRPVFGSSWRESVSSVQPADGSSNR